jgi:hypothetical protein
MNGHEKEIIIYLKENYCPTLDSQDCAHDVETHYPKMLKAVVDEFITKQARGMCHRLGACDPPTVTYPPAFKQNGMLRQFTCEDCQANGKVKSMEL